MQVQGILLRIVVASYDGDIDFMSEKITQRWLQVS